MTAMCDSDVLWLLRCFTAFTLPSSISGHKQLDITITKKEREKKTVPFENEHSFHFAPPFPKITAFWPRLKIEIDMVCLLATCANN